MRSFGIVLIYLHITSCQIIKDYNLLIITLDSSNFENFLKTFLLLVGHNLETE